MEEPKTIVLNRGRYCRFDVEELYPEVSVALVKRWVFGCFFREVLLSAEYSPPRLLKIQCRVTSESIRQEGSSHHTCVMSEKAEGIQV